MKKYVLLLLAMVFIAGCIGSRPVKIEANNGLKITEFSADPPVAEFNDNVLFTVGIENVGGTTAGQVVLNLSGLENIWRRQGGTLLTADDVKRDYGSEKFDPPLPAQNRPGDLKIYAKTFLPPILPEGVEQDFPVTARVTFKYKTSGSIVIPTISKSLLKIKTDKGEPVDSTPRISNSDGPLKIGLAKGTVPIVVDEKKGQQQEATFVIEFVNTGDGFPLTGLAGLLEGSITVLGPGVRFHPAEGCLGFTPSNGNKIDFRIRGTDPESLQKFDLLKLRSTGRLPLSCTVIIRQTAFTPTTSGSITFSIEMEYKYFVEKTINVRVIGTGEEGVAQPLPCQAPSIPSQDISCQSPEPNAITFVWDPVSGATKYTIQWCPSTSTKPFTEPLDTSCGSATPGSASHKATGLTPGTTYNFRVRAEVPSCPVPFTWSLLGSCGTAGAPSATPTPAPGTPKRVFVTSNLYAGNLHEPECTGNSCGLEGGDAKCQQAANNGNLGGTWKAWLSASDVNAKDRIAEGLYKRLDDKVIATSKSDLTDGIIAIAINIDEKKNPISGTQNVWTGTNKYGEFLQLNTCGDWGSGSSGGFGYAIETDGKWTEQGSSSCGISYRLYCFEQ